MPASAVMAWAQLPDSPGAVLPSLPGAVTHPPDWIGNTAPFDVPAFFAAPPPEENAAPLYLDALFEFGSEVAICFPEGPERQRRAQAAQERMKKLNEINTALRKDEREVSAEAMKEAGLLAVPIDPYMGAPIRMAINDGRPVVYCLGEDSQDDHGHKEAILGHDLGDVLLRVPRR